MIFKNTRKIARQPRAFTKYPNRGRWLGACVDPYSGGLVVLPPKSAIVAEMTSKRALQQAYAAADPNSYALRPQELHQQEQEPRPQYTDAAFAKDMNVLSSAEREAIVEDIHGVTKLLQETDDFVQTQINEFWLCARRTGPRSSVKREAWDRAAYLRPSLASSESHVLTFLRAARFDIKAAVSLLFRHYEVKRQLWGDALLAQRIMWNDLSSQEQDIVRSGVHWVLPKNRECPSIPRLAYMRLHTWNINPSTATSLTKALVYPLSKLLFENDDLQRRGLITVVDCRGQWQMSRWQMLQYFSQAITLFESQPVHTEVIHFLFEDPAVEETIKTMQMLLSKKHRLRCRLHFGSEAEISNSLLSFGIELPVCEGPLSSDLFSANAIESKIQEWQAKDEERRQSEARFRHPSSPAALHPNPQDILMGRNKKIASTWPGNVRYLQIIRRHARAYMEEQNRSVRMPMVTQIIDALQQNNVRFLMRNETCWMAVVASEIKSKVNQALRDEARSLARRDSDGSYESNFYRRDS